MISGFPPLAHAAELLGGEVRGDEILCPGPGHSDSDRSLSVKPSEDNREGFITHSFAGDDCKVCRDHVRKKCGLPEPKNTKQKSNGKNGSGDAWTFIDEYIYRDATGAPHTRVRKYLDEKGRKQYPQAHWDGEQWAKGKPRGPKVLYRLPELLAAPNGTLIYIVEGEKCANALAVLGFVATTNSEGATGGKNDNGKKWPPELNAYLKGYNVVIIGDNDAAGRRHVQYVAKQLQGVAESIRVLDLAEHWPGGNMPEGDDVADFLEQHDRAGSRLAKLCKEAPLWEPGADDSKDEASSDKTKSDDETGGDEASDDAGDEGDDTEKVIKRKQADTLVDLATSAAELFHTAARDAYADVMVGNHRETYRVRSKSFKSWLYHRYYKNCQGAPNSDAVQSALNVIEARALYDGPEIDVHLRVAEHEAKLYLDLADRAWRTVEIDVDGWRIVSSPPVRFRRAPGMLPLPEPVRGGSIEALRSLLNVPSDADFVLVVAWVLAALRGRGPYPIVVSTGEHGTAKTTLCKALRALIDPNTAPMRALPRNDRDAFITATNSYVMALDNVSGLPAWISDTLCRLATGGGFSTRQLFSDDSEILFDETRPIILNGIDDFATRPDLVDRAIMLTLETIPEGKRRLEGQLWAEFNREHPRLLGALLDLVVHGLRELPRTKLDGYPRMADFALWATACETAIRPAGTFMAAYEANREDAVGGTIEADLVATAVRAFMSDRTAWEGSASLLLDDLGRLITDTQRRGKGWPNLPHFLSGRLRRAAPNLRKLGILIRLNEREGKKRTRTIRITRGQPEEEGNSASAASAASAANDTNDLQRTLTKEVAFASASAEQKADAQGNARGETSVRHSPLKNQQMDAADAADAHFPAVSGSSPEDRNCRQCGGPFDGTEQLCTLDDGTTVWLHPECQRFYLEQVYR